MDIQPVNPEELPEQPAVTVENVESIEIEVPGLGVVLVGPPRQATPFVIAKIFEDEDRTPQITVAYAKALMFIKAINGVPELVPTSKPALFLLANKVGDTGLDLLMYAVQEYWPAPTSADLKVLKKNLR